MRIACSISYNGYGFSGWQKQPDVKTIQGLIESALTEIAKDTVITHASGRTDSGVHALGQIIHFDTTKNRPLTAWVKGVNAFLPNSIKVRWAKNISESFHARHSVLEREYQYLLIKDTNNSAIFHATAGWTYFDLDDYNLMAACKCFEGTHDFSSFRSSECQAKSPVRTINQFRCEQFGNTYLFTIRANGFLHHQIRNMIAAVIHVAKNEDSVGFIDDLLSKKDRTLAPPTFMPNGLYLSNIKYDNKWKLPQINNSVNIFSKNDN
jgi:tRNA pseudouridine38-40 synthase|tara:strand:- start:1205 stop:1999 length:795 start_codon:yes stop_codon:yes gene_type:complete